MPDSLSSQNHVVHTLRAELRAHLEQFYAGLRLAPPYESVEKALRALTTSLHALPDVELSRVAADPGLKWEQFRRAFVSSGLDKKHRGIIAGLVRDRTGLDLPPEYEVFLRCFTR